MLKYPGFFPSTLVRPFLLLRRVVFAGRSAPLVGGGPVVAWRSLARAVAVHGQGQKREPLPCGRCPAAVVVEP